MAPPQVPAGFIPDRSGANLPTGFVPDTTPAPAAPDPGGTWEDHPVLGKIFHPTGVKPGQDATAQNRQGNVIGFGKGQAGIAPEDLLMGGMAVRSVAGAASAGGAVGGIKEAIAQATPVIKYEAVRRSMNAAGIPDAIASPLAMVISGYRRGGGAATAAETAASDVSAPGYPRLTKTKPPTPPPGGWTPEGPPPGESLEGYPRLTPTEAPAAPTPVPQPGESLPGFPRVTQTAPAVESPLDMLLNRSVRMAESPPRGPYGSEPGYPRLTRTEAPAAPTSVPQPGESLEGYPRVTQTEAPAAPTPVPQPGESLPGFPRTTQTAPAVESPLDMLLNRTVRQAESPPRGPYGSEPGYPRLTPTEPPVVVQSPPSEVRVVLPGESLPGYPRHTVTPSATPSVLDELLNEPVRAVGRPATPAEAATANLESRVAPVVEAPPSQTANLKTKTTGRPTLPPAAVPPEEGWITPAETLQSVGAPTPTGGRGFWKGLRRGDLWPQLQEELLSTAEGPAAPTRPGRTGPGAQGKGGRFAPKAPAATADDVAPTAATPAQAATANLVERTGMTPVEGAPSQTGNLKATATGRPAKPAKPTIAAREAARDAVEPQLRAQYDAEVAAAKAEYRAAKARGEDPLHWSEDVHSTFENYAENLAGSGDPAGSAWFDAVHGAPGETVPRLARVKSARQTKSATPPKPSGTTPKGQNAPPTDWPWKLDEVTGEWIETRPPVTTSARTKPTRRAPTSAAKLRAETTTPPAPTTAESSSFEPPPPTQQEYIAQATRAFQQAKLPVPPEVASGARMISHAEMDELAMELGDKKAHLIPYDWK